MTSVYASSSSILRRSPAGRRGLPVATVVAFFFSTGLLAFLAPPVGAVRPKDDAKEEMASNATRSYTDAARHAMNFFFSEPFLSSRQARAEGGSAFVETGAKQRVKKDDKVATHEHKVLEMVEKKIAALDRELLQQQPPHSQDEMGHSQSMIMTEMKRKLVSAQLAIKEHESQANPRKLIKATMGALFIMNNNVLTCKCDGSQVQCVNDDDASPEKGNFIQLASCGAEFFCHEPNERRVTKEPHDAGMFCRDKAAYDIEQKLGEQKLYSFDEFAAFWRQNEGPMPHDPSFIQFHSESRNADANKRNGVTYMTGNTQGLSCYYLNEALTEASKTEFLAWDGQPIEQNSFTSIIPAYLQLKESHVGIAFVASEDAALALAEKAEPFRRQGAFNGIVAILVKPDSDNLNELIQNLQPLDTIPQVLALVDSDMEEGMSARILAQAKRGITNRAHWIIYDDIVGGQDQNALIQWALETRGTDAGSMVRLVRHRHEHKQDYNRQDVCCQQGDGQAQLFECCNYLDQDNQPPTSLKRTEKKGGPETWATFEAGTSRCQDAEPKKPQHCCCDQVAPGVHHPLLKNFSDSGCGDQEVEVVMSECNKEFRGVELISEKLAQGYEENMHLRANMQSEVRSSHKANEAVLKDAELLRSQVTRISSDLTGVSNAVSEQAKSMALYATSPFLLDALGLPLDSIEDRKERDGMTAKKIAVADIFRYQREFKQSAQNLEMQMEMLKREKDALQVLMGAGGAAMEGALKENLETIRKDLDSRMDGVKGVKAGLESERNSLAQAEAHNFKSILDSKVVDWHNNVDASLQETNKLRGAVEKAQNQWQNLEDEVEAESRDDSEDDAREIEIVDVGDSQDQFGSQIAPIGEKNQDVHQAALAGDGADEEESASRSAAAQVKAAIGDDEESSGSLVAQITPPITPDVMQNPEDHDHEPENSQQTGQNEPVAEKDDVDGSKSFGGPALTPTKTTPVKEVQGEVATGTGSLQQKSGEQLLQAEGEEVISVKLAALEQDYREKKAEVLQADRSGPSASDQARMDTDEEMQALLGEDKAMA